MEPGLSFSEVLVALKDGKHVQRSGWNGNGKGMSVWIHPEERFDQPNGESIHAEYLCIKGTDGIIVPWLASQRDLLAEDWKILD